MPLFFEGGHKNENKIFLLSAEMGSITFNVINYNYRLHRNA
jgi:hypothetical protein